MTKEVIVLLDGMEIAYDVWNSLEEKFLSMMKEKEVQITSRLRELKRGVKSLMNTLDNSKVCVVLWLLRKDQ